jgi:amidase
MNPNDLAFTPALEQAHLIRTQQISPTELTQLYLDRIEHFNPQLGSYFTVTADLALQDAKTKTEQLAGLQDTSGLPPFFGVPISVKDLNPMAGIPCTYGVAALKDQLATYDDNVVTRIKQAGFVILGKTATSQLGSLPYTEPEGFPPTRNPWNLDYTPGGSSGGAASALAAGLCAIAHGSDGGGSVRGPAFCCGLVGLKPSRGRVSHAPVGDRQNGIATDGCLAHTVADAAALLDVLSGYVTGDPYWLPAPEMTFIKAAQQNVSPLRIAFSTSIAPIGEAKDPCRQAVLDMAKLLEDLGHQVAPGCPDFSDLVEPFKKIWQAGVGASGIPAPALDSLNRWLLENTGSAGDYLQAVAQMQIIARRTVAFFETYDVLLLPVYLRPAIRLGEWANLPPEETIAEIIRWIAPCPPFNASGQPAIVVPTGFDHNGVPVGIQLVGKPAAEGTLLALATQIETAKPWHQFRPSICEL